MSLSSAATNVKSPIRAMGLIDAEGSPTDLAHTWRSDDQYAESCRTIRESVYPQDLLDSVPPDSPDIDRAKNWFMSVARMGDGAAGRQARTYVLLCLADVSKRGEVKSPVQGSRRKASESPKTNPKVAKSESSGSGDQLRAKVERGRVGHEEDTLNERKEPTIHIDIQIHISPETTEQQIDTIFASMAEHLYGNRSKKNG